MRVNILASISYYIAYVCKYNAYLHWACNVYYESEFARISRREGVGQTERKGERGGGADRGERREGAGQTERKGERGWGRQRGKEREGVGQTEGKGERGRDRQRGKERGGGADRGERREQAW